MPKKAAPKATDVIACTLCKGVEGLDVSDFKKHRRDVHGDTEETRLTMKPYLHMDGTDFFMNVYEILKGDLVVGSRSTSQPRRGWDKRIWADEG